MLLLFRLFLLSSVATLAAVSQPAPNDLRPIDRDIVLTPHVGEAPEDVEVRRNQQVITANPKPPADAWLRLGWAYVAKSRRTLDAGFLKLAEISARFAPADSPDNQLLLGHVLHQLHRFGPAERIAEKLVAQRGSAGDLALFSDLLMERGKLQQATSVLERMVNLRPGADAFARIAHLRWLKGDPKGAIAAIEHAIQSTTARDTETMAWMLCRLSGYHLGTGDIARAVGVAEIAVAQAKDYPPALLAHGRALLAQGKNESALAALRQGAALNPLPEYQWWLADALVANGHTAEARTVEGELHRRGELGDPRTYALFLATRGVELPTAIRLARQEQQERADIFSHDALAWSLLADSPEEAAVEMKRALAENTQDARLWWHAGEIELRRGNVDVARAHFRHALPLAATLTPGERRRLEARTRENPAATATVTFVSDRNHDPKTTR